jgi:hypothetical protein
MKMKNTAILFLLFFSVCFWGCDASVNRSIHLRDGEHSGGLNSVNGSIHVPRGRQLPYRQRPHRSGQ